jgi:hypothetical protein
MEKLAKQFCDTVGLKKFNQDKWFIGAYGTMQRTKKGGISINQKQNIKTFIFNEIYNNNFEFENQTEFDSWIFNTIKSVSVLGNLTIGQSQKIINILLKYYYCYYYSKIDNDFCVNHRHLEKTFQFLHAPVDNIILVALKEKFDNQDISSIIISSNNARFYIEDDDKFYPWSKLDDYEEYIKVQNFIEKLSSKEQLNGKLHFEMKYLWQRK